MLAATFLLTIFKDLTYGIVAGFVIASMLFINRMAKGTSVGSGLPGSLDDRADSAVPYDPALATDPDVVVYRISGAFFFAAASTVASVLDRIADRHKALVIDFSAVSLVDSTAANAIAGVVEAAERKKVRMFIAGAQPYVRQALLAHGVREPAAQFRPDVATAVVDARIGIRAPAA